MAKVVKAKQRYQVNETGSDTEVIVRRKSPGRIWLTFILSLPLGLAVAVALIGFNKGGAMPAFGLMAALGALWWWGLGDITDKFRIDDRGIAKRGKLYLFEDINSLSYRNRLGTKIDFHRRRATTDAHNLASEYGYGLYILYGSKEVGLTTGFTEFEAEQIYEVLRGVFGKYGHRFA
ncbi:hypothetical protein [Hyphococcus sp.]|uniref:hypothetical protein n=1 Tax=Hyphococcus sp. TaxID=2038636 RepID=UPI003D09E029